MYRFVLRRLLSGVLLLFVITTVAYLLLYAGGGDIARRIVGPTASQAQVTLKASQLGLNRPLVVQYWDWLTHAVTGDLGPPSVLGVPPGRRRAEAGGHHPHRLLLRGKARPSGDRGTGRGQALGPLPCRMSVGPVASQIQVADGSGITARGP